MQLLKWFIKLFATDRTVQTYQHDRRFTYILILIVNGVTFNRGFSSSSPLQSGHRIVLTPGKAFTTSYIVHVTYTANDVLGLTRPTTFVHVGISMDIGQKLNPEELNKLGFDVADSTFPYTIH